MRQYSKDVTRQPMRRKDIQKFHRLHLKPKIPINHQQDNIGNLRKVHHTVDVVIALDEGESPPLPSDDCNGALDGGKGVLGVALHEGLYQCGFPGTWGADDGADDWGWFLRGSVHHGDMEFLLFNLSTQAISFGKQSLGGEAHIVRSYRLLCELSGVCEGEGFRVAIWVGLVSNCRKRAERGKEVKWE